MSKQNYITNLLELKDENIHFYNNSSEVFNVKLSKLNFFQDILIKNNKKWSLSAPSGGFG